MGAATVAWSGQCAAKTTRLRYGHSAGEVPELEWHARVSAAFRYVPLRGLAGENVRNGSPFRHALLSRQRRHIRSPTHWLSKVTPQRRHGRGLRS